MFIALLPIIYLAFIGLGIPDSLLGAAWPSIYPQINAPMSYAGLLSMIICVGTIISSLKTDALIRKLGTAKVTAISTALTAAALFGYSFSSSFISLCLWSIPYGFGAGSVDASLNNYVATHYESKHMSWLHCMWGVGATLGPYLMGQVLAVGYSWTNGYRLFGLLQLVLTAILFFSTPLWKKGSGDESSVEASSPLSLRELLSIPGVKAVTLAFFCYCGLEQTAALWAASYLNIHIGFSSETSASLGGMFFFGITFGRALSGFISSKLGDDKMVRLGLGVIAVGCGALLLPVLNRLSPVWLILIGLGCAPVYPSLIHSTPMRFGADKSQALIGLQMASAYVGICLIPPLFGMIAEYIDISLLPVFLIVFLIVLVIAFVRLVKKQ